MNNSFKDHFPLRKSRAHEVTGPTALSFAAIACGYGGKGAMWIVESWQQETLNPVGLAPFCDPAKVVLVRADSPIDVLAASEEALRSGALSTVVAELTKPLGLTAGRRLQLAAETGKTTGVFIISDGTGSNATETRWRCSPEFDAQDSTLQRWELIKNKSGTLKIWRVRWDAETRRVIVVSEAGE